MSHKRDDQSRNVFLGKIIVDAKIGGISGKFSFGDDSFTSAGVGGRVKESDAPNRQALTHGDPNTRPLPPNEDKAMSSSARQGYAASSSNSTMRRKIFGRFRNMISEGASDMRQTIKIQDRELQALVNLVKSNKLADPIDAHTRLAKATLRDTNQTLRAYEKFDELCIADPFAMTGLGLHQYDCVRNRLGKDFRKLIGKNFNHDVWKKLYFNDSYWKRIAKPAIERLSEAKQICEELSAQIKRFVIHSADLISGDPDARSKAFDELHMEFWCDQYPGEKSKATKNPQKFIAQTYNSMSLALGYVGTQISILKPLKQKMEKPTGKERQQIQMTDDAYNAYKNACDVMDQVYDSLKDKKAMANKIQAMADKIRQQQRSNASNERLAQEPRQPVGGGSAQPEHLPHMHSISPPSFHTSTSFSPGIEQEDISKKGEENSFNVNKEKQPSLSLKEVQNKSAGHQRLAIAGHSMEMVKSNPLALEDLKKEIDSKESDFSSPQRGPNPEIEKSSVSGKESLADQVGKMADRFSRNRRDIHFLAQNIQKNIDAALGHIRSAKPETGESSVNGKESLADQVGKSADSLGSNRRDSLPDTKERIDASSDRIQSMLKLLDERQSRRLRLPPSMHQ